MAELLIRATDSHLVGSGRDYEAWKRGDPVQVQADGWGWGRNELNHPDNDRALCVLKVPGVSVDVVQKYLAEHWDPLGLTKQNRRQYRVVLDDLTPAQANTIRATGTLSLTITQAKRLIENRVDLKREA